jgi:hypothetical protein
MELGSPNIALPGDGTEPTSVIGPADSVRRAFRLNQVRVHEVKVGAVRNPAQKRVINDFLHLIPSDVRYTKPVPVEFSYGTRDQIQASMAAELFASVEEQLESKA